MSDLIVSDPEVGIKSYGLTPHGRQQVIQVIVPSLQNLFSMVVYRAYHLWWLAVLCQAAAAFY